MAAIHHSALSRPAPLPMAFGRGMSAVVFAPITALFGMAFETRIGLLSAAVVAWIGVVVMLQAQMRRAAA